MSITINTPNVALIGRMGSGKSTIAQLLTDLYGYQRFSWAQPVKDIASLAYGPIDKSQGYEVEIPTGDNAVRTGREILQRIGTDAMREQVDRQFWIRAGTRRIEARDDIRWVNDDTRFPNEADALARRGWAVIRLKLPDEVRRARLYQSYGYIDEDALNHASESEVDDILVHLELWNTGSPISTVEALMQTLAKAALHTA
jgi:energy-coupling factor transporter ATP-binding protein EcfA2